MVLSDGIVNFFPIIGGPCVFLAASQYAIAKKCALSAQGWADYCYGFGWFVDPFSAWGDWCTHDIRRSIVVAAHSCAATAKPFRRTKINRPLSLPYYGT